MGAAQLQVKGVGSVGGEEANGQLLLLAFFFFSSRQCLLVGNHKITGTAKKLDGRESYGQVFKASQRFMHRV